MDLTGNPRYAEARRHARKLRGFYSHALIYVLVNAGLAAINLATSPERIWFAMPLFGWGIGLVAHGFSVFALRGVFGPQWEERKIREYLDRR